ncbi:MAG: protein kinase [Rhodobacterales bacterium]|nr:protein kinase [Rhodobacterales bacterium]
MDLPAPFGKYELIKRIATGGMAEVYLARSFGVAGFEKRLVIKRIRPESADDPRFVKMFINEAKIGVHLNHPNVVQVYELGRVGPMYYIAMEHLHGQDLTRLVKTLRAEERRLPIPVACYVVAEICRGLAYAHGRQGTNGSLLGLVHQDVSPHNILVTYEGAVKLVDFGIARLMNTAEADNRTGNSKGRPGGGKYAYMSPEQAIGGVVDHRTDVFSAGIVLWELLVGHRLFRHQDPSKKLALVQDAVIPDPADEGIELDPELWAIIQKALTKDVDQRYASATLFEEDLRAWLFEARHRVGRNQVAEWMADAFPGQAGGGVNEFQLQRMVADVERLDAGDRTHSIAHPGRGSSEESSLPGRLPMAVGERKTVAVVMIDVDGLTDLSTRIEPEQLFMRHYQLLRWCRRIVDRYSGRVQSVVDDHITLFFGVPRTRVGDVVNAIECAMELQRRVGELREVGLGVELALGIHQGEVTVSQVTPHKVRYVARGDTTRLARRLSAAADHAQIVVSERISEAARGAFSFRRGPALPSRSGKAPIASLIVEGRPTGLRIAGRGPWIRRGGELNILRGGLVLLARGTGAAVVIHGPMGTGKSRLVHEIHELANKRGLPFYAARCPSREARHPMHVFADLLRQVLGVPSDAPLERTLRHVERLSQLGLNQRDLQAIGAIFGARTQHAPSEPELWQALEACFKGLARESPFIVALDNVHEFGTEPTQRLSRLIKDTRPVSLMWLLTYRGVPGRILSQVARPVDLSILKYKVQSKLVASLLGVRDVGKSLIRLVVENSEGNPLYIQEVLKYLMEHGHIEIEEGYARLSDAGTVLRLPNSLAALIGARIDELDSGSKGALQLASVLGRTFHIGLLAEAAGLEDAGQLVGILSTHGLVQSVGDDRWRFVSDMIFRAVKRGILGVQLRDYHRLITGAIESLHKDNLDDWQQDLAVHCAGADRPVDAARYALKAGRAEEAEGRVGRAGHWYQVGLAALAAAERSPDTWEARTQGEATLRLELGRTRLDLGELSAGLHEIQLALDISADAGLPWIEVRAHLELGKSYLQQSKFMLAGAHISQTRALLRIEKDRELEQESLEVAARLAFEQGKNQEAEDLWHQALKKARGDVAATARCQIGLANRYLRSGNYVQARPLLKRGLASARRARDPILEGRVLNNIGLMHSWSGEYAEALTYYRKALEVRQGMGYRRGVVVNHHNVGDTHLALGDWARAWVSFERSRELAAEMGWEGGVVLNEVYLAFIAATRGQSDETPILEATERARKLGDPDVTTAGSWLAGRYLAGVGRKVAAVKLFQQGLQDARKWNLNPMLKVIDDALASLEVTQEMTLELDDD